MNDIWRMTAVEVASLVRAKKISAREAMASALARLEQANPLINAVVDYRPEYSLAQADAVDAAIARGEDAGSAHRRADHDQGAHRSGRLCHHQRPDAPARFDRQDQQPDGRQLLEGGRNDRRPHQHAGVFLSLVHQQQAARAHEEPAQQRAHAGRLLRRRVGGDRRRYRSHRSRHRHRGFRALSGLCGRHPRAAAHARPRAELQRIGPGALDRLADHGGVGTARAHDRRLAPRVRGDGRAASARCA